MNKSEELLSLIGEDKEESNEFGLLDSKNAKMVKELLDMEKIEVDMSPGHEGGTYFKFKSKEDMDKARNLANKKIDKSKEMKWGE